MGGSAQTWMALQNDQTAPPAPPPPSSPNPQDSASQGNLPTGTTNLGSSGPNTVIPVTQGSTADLENQVNPDQALLRIHQQAQQTAQQQSPQPGSFSPDNPQKKTIDYFQGQLDLMGPPSNSRGVKGALTTFFKGAAERLYVQIRSHAVLAAQADTG
jgi:hypothetical protein